jgi:hypothetical protein
MAFTHSWQAVMHPGQSDDFFKPHHGAAFAALDDGFNPVNAWWLSEMSRLIYKRDHTEGVAAPLSRDDYLGRVGLRERRFFNHPHIQASLVETISSDQGAFSALVFRGTAGRVANWRFNLDLTLCAWPAGGRVHRGFAHLIMQLWEAIAVVLERAHQPLYFTGHSLGGALATLAASMHAPRAVYTFGAPRIGDRAFARTLSQVRVFNIINPRDVVTHLPPEGLGPRFCHAGTTIHNGAPYPPRRSLGQAPAFLADHAPLNYTAQFFALSN